jgi:hypothetical protein
MNWRWWALIPAALGGYLIVVLVHAQVLQWVTWRGNGLVALATAMAAIAAVAWVFPAAKLIQTGRCLAAGLLAGALVIIDIWQMVTVPAGLSDDRRLNTLLPLAAQAITAVVFAIALCAHNHRQAHRPGGIDV